MRFRSPSTTISSVSVFGERLIVLRDLVALREVRIKIIFARETRERVDSAMQRQRCANGQFHRLAAEHRQRARQAEANRADIRVWRRSKFHCTTAENFRLRAELDVHFQPDNRFIFR